MSLSRRLLALLLVVTVTVFGSTVQWANAVEDVETLQTSTGHANMQLADIPESEPVHEPLFAASSLPKDARHAALHPMPPSADLHVFEPPPRHG